MVARKRSEEYQKAGSQKIQEKVHQILFCDTDWNEDEVYKRRFEMILRRANLHDLHIDVDDTVAVEYRRRIERKLKGKEILDKSLIFYKILNYLQDQPMSIEIIALEMDSHSLECICNNLIYMEKCGIIENNDGKFKLSHNIRKLFLKTK